MPNRSDVRAKRSVALLVYPPGERGRFVVVRRPPGPEEELPEVWGLPAATLRPGETDEEAVHRLSRTKLGTEVRVVGELAQGAQDRPGYRLEMVVYEAELAGPEPTLPHPPPESGVTYYTAWRWADSQALVEACERGSLCARLTLQALRGSPTEPRGGRRGGFRRSGPPGIR